MDQRLDHAKSSPEGFRAMLGVEKHVRESVDPTLLHLIKVRASQINACAYCIDMHWKDARAAGESEQRLYGLSSWRESPYYTDRERAVLAWTEALTLIAVASSGHAPDEAYDAVRSHFSDKQLTDISWAIAAINAWNRLAVGFRSTPGEYQPPKPRA